MHNNLIMMQTVNESDTLMHPPMSGSSVMEEQAQGPNLESKSDSEDSDIPGVAKGALEDDIMMSQKLDTVSILYGLRLTSTNASRMRIPLCRLVPMPIVRPTLACDLTLLEHQFCRGYEEGARVFYVSVLDEDGQSAVFSTAEKEEWGPVWNSVNDDFNNFLKSQSVLKHLVDQKFYICDGNHRRIAWMNHITRLHAMERSWHITVDSIVLDTRDRIGVAMQAMHDINK